MNIIYFSPIPYDGLRQRPQYIAEGLSQKHHVYYIEPTVRLTSCLMNRGTDYKGRVHQVSPTLDVVRCNGTFVLPFKWNVYDLFSLNGIAERIYLNDIIKKADYIIVGFEGWMNVLSWVHNKKIVYDKMDDNTKITPEWPRRKYLERCEKKLWKRVWGAIVTAQKFYEEHKEQLANIHLVPNGVDLECDDIKEGAKANDEKVYGYVGMLEEWFDMEIVKAIAGIKGNRVILVGPCNIEKYQTENVVYTGRVEKKEVANMIQTFDVCLYPFKKSDWLDTINPVKIYEYLAMNKPVIAVDSLETRGFGERVYRYKDKEELEKLCKKDLLPPFKNKDECDRFIKENSWKNRVEQILNILEEK